MISKTWQHHHVKIKKHMNASEEVGGIGIALPGFFFEKPTYDNKGNDVVFILIKEECHQKWGGEGLDEYHRRNQQEATFMLSCQLQVSSLMFCLSGLCFSE